MIKYEATITGIGELAPEFFEQQMIILFDDNAPAELKEICVTHTKGRLNHDIVTGDLFHICDEVYCVTAVGDMANKNIGLLGHATLRFNGNATAELPGDICLSGMVLTNVSIGGKIMIKD